MTRLSYEFLRKNGKTALIYFAKLHYADYIERAKNFSDGFKFDVVGFQSFCFFVWLLVWG